MSVDRNTRYVQCASMPMLSLTKTPLVGMACVLGKGHSGPHQDREGRKRP